MGNTGIKTTLVLDQMIPPYPPPNPTGLTKPNVMGDPDYVAPYENLTDCPVTFDTVCPIVAATGLSGQASFEFSLPNSTINNPLVDTVRVKLMNGVTVVGTKDFVLPNITPNYFKDSIVGSPGSRTIALDYLDAGAGVIASCTNLATITIT